MGRRALAPHLAWPVSKADLREALGDRFCDVEVTWVDWDKQGGQEPRSVSWRSEAAEMPGWDAGGAPTVWVHPVSRATLEETRTLLLRHALPDLIAWLDSAFAAPETWRQARHERRWVIGSGGVAVHDDHGLHILDRERGTR